MADWARGQGPRVRETPGRGVLALLSLGHVN